jgi:hypothetical protein
MKSKYYPLVTVVGASLVAGLPVFILWASLGSEEQARAVRANPPDASGISIPKVPVTLSPTTALSPRIAMSNMSTVRLPIEPHRSATETELEKRPEPNFSRESIVKSMPAPISPTDDFMPIIPEAVAELAVSELAASPMPEAELAQAELDSMPEIPQRPIVSDSHYEATGHLALSSQPLVPDAVMISRPTDATELTAEKGDVKKSSDGRRTRKQKRDEVPDAESDLRHSANIAEGNQLPEGLIEDVAIQTPLETQPVGRVENVVAVTRAKGWPVALIKSDLPDDVWWVQQMVGIQGTSFNARVNFGNEYTLSGTQYQMVIMFLDSADEVRRFRIAKQFKDVPAGVRRSREFRYIRN